MYKINWNIQKPKIFGEHSSKGWTKFSSFGGSKKWNKFFYGVVSYVYEIYNNDKLAINYEARKKAIPSKENHYSSKEEPSEQEKHHTRESMENWNTGNGNVMEGDGGG